MATPFTGEYARDAMIKTAKNADYTTQFVKHVMMDTLKKEEHVEIATNLMSKPQTNTNENTRIIWSEFF